MGEGNETKEIAEAIAKLPETITLLYSTYIALGAGLHYAHPEEDKQEILEGQYERLKEFFGETE